MKEKILKELQKARPANSSISDRTLEDLTSNYVNIIETDEQLEKVNFENVIKSIDGNISATASKAAQKAAEDAKKEVKPIEPEKKIEPKKEGENEVNTLLTEQLKKMQERLDAIESSKIVSSRKEKLKALATKLPKNEQEELLTDFDTMSFTDDAAFESFTERKAKTIETRVEQITQMGGVIPVPSGVKIPKEPESTGNKAIDKAMKVVKEAKKEADKK